jgi:hypothetical protein
MLYLEVNHADDNQDLIDLLDDPEATCLPLLIGHIFVLVEDRVVVVAQVQQQVPQQLELLLFELVENAVLKDTGRV